MHEATAYPTSLNYFNLDLLLLLIRFYPYRQDRGK